MKDPVSQFLDLAGHRSIPFVQIDHRNIKSAAVGALQIFDNLALGASCSEMVYYNENFTLHNKTLYIHFCYRTSSLPLPVYLR